MPQMQVPLSGSPILAMMHHVEWHIAIKNSTETTTEDIVATLR